MSDGMNHEAIRALVARSCIALDDEDFGAYLGLCSEDFRYRIVAFSQEIRKDMVWLDVDRPAMEALLEMVPNHARMEGSLRRHVSVYTMEPAGPGRASVRSSFMVTLTSPAGESRLYAVGQFEDEVDLSADAPRIARRQVRLQTRVLAPHSHVPI